MHITWIVLILTVTHVWCTELANVTTKWTTVVREAKTIPTFQLVQNPLTRRESKIGKQVFQNVRELGAEMSRFALWFPYPHLAVAELFPPNCSAAPPMKTSWSFDLLDPMIQDWFDAQGGRDSYLNVCTQPNWMYKQDTPLPPLPSDPNQVMWNYAQGRTLLDPTGKQLAAYYSRFAQWYTLGKFTDECGTEHRSALKLKIPVWEVFNEIESEHGYNVQDYTIQYDAIVSELRKVMPDTKYVALALCDPTNHKDFVSYFLNSSNHVAGIPLDWISFHYYVLLDNTAPLNTWHKLIFDATDGFVVDATKVLAIKDQLSPTTRTDINEFGVIISQSATQPVPDPIPDIYWNICAAQYGYAFGKMTLIGLDALGMSQMVGFPTQFPSVSMVDWDTGKGNARYNTLKLIIKHFAPDGGSRKLQVVDTNTTGELFALSYIVVESNGQTLKKSLIVNKSPDTVSIRLNNDIELHGGTLEYIDVRTGAFGAPAVEKFTQSILIGGFGVAVVTYN